MYTASGFWARIYIVHTFCSCVKCLLCIHVLHCYICIVHHNWAYLTWKSAIEIKLFLSFYISQSSSYSSNKTKQNKTKNKARQDKTRQDKTRQDKIKDDLGCHNFKFKLQKQHFTFCTTMALKASMPAGTRLFPAKQFVSLVLHGIKDHSNLLETH